MQNEEKVTIKMKPYNAAILLSFCREFVNYDLPNEYRFQSIKEAVDELHKELSQNFTSEQWEQVRIENQINQMTGKSPQARSTKK